MSYTVTLSASILIQDTAPATPVTVAQDAKTDQLTSESEFLELSVTVPPSAINQTLDLAGPGFAAQSLYIFSSQPITMKQGSSTFPQPIRSLFVGSYATAQAPASLKFSNPGSQAAQVKVILGT